MPLAVILLHSLAGQARWVGTFGHSGANINLIRG